MIAPDEPTIDGNCVDDHCEICGQFEAECECAEEDEPLAGRDRAEPGPEQKPSSRSFYEEGYAATTDRTLGLLALPRRMAVEGEKVPYLKGVVARLRQALESAEQDLAAAEVAQDRAVSLREEFSSR